MFSISCVWQILYKYSEAKICCSRRLFVLTNYVTLSSLDFNSVSNSFIFAIEARGRKCAIKLSVSAGITLPLFNIFSMLIIRCLSSLNVIFADACVRNITLRLSAILWTIYIMYIMRLKWKCLNADNINEVFTLYICSIFLQVYSWWVTL